MSPDETEEVSKFSDVGFDWNGWRTRLGLGTECGMEKSVTIVMIPLIVNVNEYRFPKPDSVGPRAATPKTIPTRVLVFVCTNPRWSTWLTIAG